MVFFLNFFPSIISKMLEAIDMWVGRENIFFILFFLVLIETNFFHSSHQILLKMFLCLHQWNLESIIVGSTTKGETKNYHKVREKYQVFSLRQVLFFIFFICPKKLVHRLFAYRYVYFLLPSSRTISVRALKKYFHFLPFEVLNMIKWKKKRTTVSKGAKKEERNENNNYNCWCFFGYLNFLFGVEISWERSSRKWDFRNICNSADTWSICIKKIQNFFPFFY